MDVQSFVTLNTTLHALILHLEDGNITIWKVWHKSLFFKKREYQKYWGFWIQTGKHSKQGSGKLEPLFSLKYFILGEQSL